MSGPRATSLQRTVRRTLAQRRLVRGVRTLVVGCSGGPDSSALLHVLHALRPAFRFELRAVGVDHGLRPEAGAELAQAAALARSLGVPFELLRADLTGGQGSLQARARRARYALLRGAAARHPAAAIAVGHTLDDQAETVLARLLRGPSVAGLAGIQPRRADGVIRPLIDCRRAQVAAYVRQHGLRVARDPSNADPTFLRARVRGSLLPSLCAENPALVEQLAALADDARAAAQALDAAGAALLRRAGVNAGPWREEPAAVRRCAFRHWVREEAGLELGRAHLEALDAMLRRPGEVALPRGWVARVGARDMLELTRGAKRGRGR